MNKMIELSPAAREVAELVGCLHDLARADWLSDETADILTRAADLLERLAPQPVPPADGEVAELVGFLNGLANSLILPTELNDQLHSAADLLSRLAPQPEPERPSTDELHQVFLDHAGYIDDEQVMWSGRFCVAARAALARWGTPNLAQARSSLGDGPAVPESREPAAVMEEPSDEELWELFDWLKDEWRSNNEGEFPLPLFARAVLARWGAPHV